MTGPSLPQSKSTRQHARELLICIDRTASVTFARQIEEQVREAILSGLLTKGSRLPSSRVLAEDLGVSRGVASRAYAQLAFEGYLDIHRGTVPTVLPVRRIEPARESTKGQARLRYDLRPHLPEVNAFPRGVWLRCVRSSLARATEADLTYKSSAGLSELRAEIASYLRRARGVDVDPGRVVVTSGSTQAISLISRMLIRRDAKQIAFENPSHSLLREVARAAGPEIGAVPVDEEGIIVELLGDADAVVVAPAHQFPTGVALSPKRRQQLTAWATDSGGLIVEHDYDAEFRYGRPPMAALQSLAPEHTIYLGSTGKTFLPALRLGWAVLPVDLIEAFSREMFSATLQISGLDQLAFYDFLHHGEFDRHLRRMRDVYRRRRDALLSEMLRLLPDVPIAGVDGGLHIVAELPSHEVAEAVRTRLLLEDGVALETIGQHALPGYEGPAGLIIGFGCTPEPSLVLAAREIGRVVIDELSLKTTGDAGSLDDILPWALNA